MTGTKSMFKSLGMMGPAVSLIVLAANFFAGDQVISDADMQEIINAAMTLFGLVSGIWGRYKATQEIA